MLCIEKCLCHLLLNSGLEIFPVSLLWDNSSRKPANNEFIQVPNSNWSTAQKTGFVISDCHFQCWFLVHLYRSPTAVGDERLDWVAGHLMFYWRSSAGRCHTSSLLSLLVHWKQISSCQPVMFCIVNNIV